MAEKSEEELKKDLTKLKKDKSALIEKNRSLAEIIEEITKERDDDKKSKSSEDEKEISSVVKKEIESELSGIGDKLKDIEKISELAEKVKELSDQVKSASAPAKPQTMKVQGPLGETEVPVNQPPPASPFGGPTEGTQTAQNILSKPATGPVGKALASFGEDVDFQTEIIEIKNSITELNKNLNNLQKKTEYRVSRLEDETKALDRISELEQGFEEISEKLSPENVAKLKKLIFSTDELVDEVIPDLINKRLRTRIDPILGDLGNVKNSMEVLNTRFVGLRNDIKQLQKFENDVNELGLNLKLERERTSKKMDEYEDKALEAVENLREDIKKKIEKISEDLSKVQTKSTQVIGDIVKGMFLDIVDPKFSDIEKGQVVFEERLKKLFENIEKVKTQVSKLKAPENLKQWIDDKGSEIEKKLQLDVLSVVKDKLSVIDGIRKEVTKNDKELDEIRNEMLTLRNLEKTSAAHGEFIDNLKERTRNLEDTTKNIPRTLEYHQKQLNKLADTRDLFGRDIEKLFGETKALTEKATKSEKDISSVGSELKSVEKTTDSKFDGVTNDLLSIHDNIKTLEEFMNKLSAEVKSNESELREDISDTRVALSVLLEKKIDSLKKDLERVRDRDLRNQLNDFKSGMKRVSDVDSDIKFLRNKLESLQESNKNLEKRLGVEIPETMNSLVTDMFQDVSQNITSDISQIKSDVQQERELVNKRMDIHESQINKLIDTKETIGKQADVLNANLKSLKENVTASSERLTALEKEAKAMEKLYDSRFTDVTNSLTSLQTEVADQADFTQTIAKNFGAMENKIDSNVNELRKELSTDFEDALSSAKEDLEKKLFQDAEHDLERFKSEISRINAIEQNLTALEKSYGSFTDRVKSDLAVLLTSPQDIQLLKKKLKELETIDKDLEMKLNSLKAPENIKKWFDAKVEDFHKRLASDIRELEAKIAKQAETQTDLRDSVLTLTNISRDIPKNLEKQQHQINRILDSRESLSNQTNAIQANLKQLVADLESERERVTNIEKTVGSGHEPRLDELSQNITAIKQDIDNIQEFTGSSVKELNDSVSQLKDNIAKAESKLALRFDKTVANLRDDLAKSRDKEFKNQMEKFRQEMERIASVEQDFRSFESHEKQTNNELSERLSRLEKAMPELKYLHDRIEAMEEDSKKVAEIVSKNQVQIVEAIEQKTADRKKLEQNLQGQRAKLAELLKELKK